MVRVMQENREMELNDKRTLLTYVDEMSGNSQN